MTIETDDTRQPPHEVREIPGQPGYIVHPILDPVRSAALAAAVDLVAGLGTDRAVGSDDLADYTLDMARRFEDYLTGDQPEAER